MGELKEMLYIHRYYALAGAMISISIMALAFAIYLLVKNRRGE